MTALDTAVELLGLQPLAKLCNVSYQAVRKWQRTGRLPRTEWTGETRYAELIEQATQHQVTRTQLLSLPAPNAGTSQQEAA